MPRSARKVPAYCRHKASGLAVVRVNAKDHYLGPYGSEESYAEYERTIAEWRSSRRVVTPPSVSLTSDEGREGHRLPTAEVERLTVTQLILSYLRFAIGYYVHRDGTQSKEYQEMVYALAPVRELYGRMSVEDFGPLALKAVRQQMIDDGLCRSVVNHRVNRIKRAFKWAVSEQLAPQGSYQALCTVAGLRRGRSKARESEPVRPVAVEVVEACLPHMSRQVAAMVRVQLLTAMRPGEVVQIRSCDVTRSEAVWLYSPPQHKGQWRELDRVIPLGPQAQAILLPFIEAAATQSACLFSPAAAEDERNAARRAARKTPMTPSQAARKKKADPKRAKRDHYDRDSYRRAIQYAIQRGNRERAREAGDEYVPIPHWCPLQLRHSRATELRKRYGIEAAQVMLGHARADVTQVYAERNLDAAIAIAREIG